MGLAAQPALALPPALPPRVPPSTPGRETGGKIAGRNVKRLAVPSPLRKTGILSLVFYFPHGFCVKQEQPVCKLHCSSGSERGESLPSRDFVVKFVVAVLEH